MNCVTYKFDLHQCVLAWSSDLGTREEQQDSYYINRNEDSILAVVCDGMGGLSNGRTASTIAIQKIGELFKKKDSTESFPSFFIASSDLLDEAVCAYSKRNDNGEKSGTTIAAAAIQSDKLYWFSCGDSRIYIVRNGEIAQITQDHNYQTQLDALLEQGEITKTQYVNESSRGDALISYIGMGGVEKIDINTAPFILKNDDLIILMTDGLYKAIDNAVLANVAKTAENVEILVNQLSQKAYELSHGVQDNTTIIIIKYQETQQ